MEELILPPWIDDDIHFDAKEIDGYNKLWNCVVSQREVGKSTLMWKKIYNAFRRNGFPSIVLKRKVVDVTEQYIEDNISLIEKFTGIRLPFEFKKGDIKNGLLDLKINGKVFVRIIALSCPISRPKSLMVKNVKYIMMDEMICNMRFGEKYETGEIDKIKEIYTTFNRESAGHEAGGIKMYFFANPYSLYCPLFSYLNVDTKQLYAGNIVAGENYVVQCYVAKKELQEQILKNNKLYSADAEYRAYAFDGRAINDEYIRIVEQQPTNFRLLYVMKLNGKCIGIYNGFDEILQLCYWCKIIDENKISKRRDILCFDFGSMANQTVLMNPTYKIYFTKLKQCMTKRWIAYASIEESWMMEEIYTNL